MLRPPTPVTQAMAEGLLILLKGGHAINLGLVVDGLSDDQNDQLGRALAWLFLEAGKAYYKVNPGDHLVQMNSDSSVVTGRGFALNKFEQGRTPLY